MSSHWMILRRRCRPPRSVPLSESYHVTACACAINAKSENASPQQPNTRKERTQMSNFHTPPSDVGMDESKLALIRKSIENDIENERSDGSVILVARAGRIVMHEAIGHSDRRNGRKAKIDDVL